MYGYDLDLDGRERIRYSGRLHLHRSVNNLPPGPLHSKHGHLVKVLLRILFVQVSPVKVSLREFLQDILVSLDELLLNVSRVIDEIRVLRKGRSSKKVSNVYATRRAITGQATTPKMSPPSESVRQRSLSQ